MLGQLIPEALGLVLLYMTVWFVFAKARKQLNFVDIAWGGGFALIAWLAYLTHHAARTLLIAVLVTIWAVRIIRHLAPRVLKHGEDPRYAEMTKKWKGNFWVRAYFSVFVLQGLIIALICLPVMVATGEQNENLGILSVLGTALWAVGFLFESTGDRQLRNFVADPANKGKVMDQGLWRFSRHPNYFGELTQWWGIAIIALQVTNGWVGLFGPLALTILIVFVSGIPPIENKKKQEPDYAAYMKRTSMLIPLPPKR